MRLVLVVAGGLVELLQATPLIRSLHSSGADLTITLACAPGSGAITRLVPGIDDVLELAGLDAEASPRALLSTWLRLRRLRADAALLCTSDPRVRLLVYAAGLARRVGPRGGLTGILLSDRVGSRSDENNAATWVRLGTALGIRPVLHRPLVEPGEDARREAENLIFGTAIADGRPLIALAPGHGFEGVGGETWAPARYAHLANQLARRHAAAVVMVGPAGDRAAVDQTEVDLEAPVLDLCGRTDIPTVAAVLDHCDLLVGTDSPLLHVGAAMGTAVVGLFGASDGRRRGPFGGEHRVVQALGKPGSVSSIRVEDVLAAIEAAL